jgi:hypothetical protein
MARLLQEGFTAPARQIPAQRPHLRQTARQLRHTEPAARVKATKAGVRPVSPPHILQLMRRYYRMAYFR